MTAIRWLRCLLLAVIAAEATAFLLTGPRWRSAVPPDVYLAGFSADGRTLAAVSTHRFPQAGTQAAQLHVWDTATGRRRTVPAGEQSPRGGEFHAILAPDGRSAVVWEEVMALLCSSASDRTTRDTGLVRRVVSTETGRPLGDRLPSTQYSHPTAFAPDGTLAAVTVDRGYGGVAWHALPGGAVAHHVGLQPDEWTNGFAFAPDGRHAAYVRCLDRPTLVRTLEVVTVPTGTPVHAMPLPGEFHWQVTGWAGDRVAVARSPIARDRTGIAPTFAADLATGELTQLPVAEEWTPTERVRREAGPGWVAAIREPTQPDAPKPPAWLVRAAGWVGVTVEPRAGYRCSVSLFDEAGHPRSAVQVWTTRDVRVSPDGRAVATTAGPGVVELWPTDPPAVWRWATAAGVLTFAGTAAAERRFRRPSSRPDTGS